MGGIILIGDKKNHILHDRKVGSKRQAVDGLGKPKRQNADFSVWVVR